MALDTTIHHSGAGSTPEPGNTVAANAAKAAEIEKEELEKEYGLTTEDIVKAVKRAIERKKG